MNWDGAPRLGRRIGGAGNEEPLVARWEDEVRDKKKVYLQDSDVGNARK